ncbi:MAG: PQQ-binding-like beta-propeller repeat protein [Fuerstiella sp.]
MLFLLSIFTPVTLYGGEPVSADRLAGWHHWRGPYANGQAAESARPPLAWSDTQGVEWVAEIPGEGSSTPIVWQDRIFVLSAERTDRQAERPPAPDERSKTIPPDVYYRFLVSCIDRNSGDVLWRRLAVEAVPHEGHHPTHSYAAGSPTTDGQRLYASFGSRGIFCYTLGGQPLWQTDLGDMRTRYGWGEAVTPVFHQDSLVINWDQEEGSFIVCLDAATGDVKWKTDRPGEVTSWNTPLITTFEGRDIVVANGTHRVRAYDLADGNELWSCGGQTVNAIPSPVRHRDFVIAMSGYRGAATVAIPLGAVGDVTDSDVLRWKASRGMPYVPSPVLSNNRLSFTGGNGDILTTLDADTGRPLHSPRRLSGLGSVYASPISAGGHLYFLGRDGTCIVLTDDDEMSVVSVNRISDATDASPVAVGDQLLLRSRSRLYSLTD